MEPDTKAPASKVAGSVEADRYSGSYTADNGRLDTVAAVGTPGACAHEGFYYCKHCGLDLTPDIAPFTGTYGDGPNCARSMK